MTDKSKLTSGTIHALDPSTGEVIIPKIRIYGKNDPPPGPVINFVDDPGFTQQHFKEECDINHILERYSQTGIVPERHGAFYGDFSDSIEYREALDQLMSTQNEFNALPARTRDFFGNDPGRFLDFVSNPENKQHFATIGLVEAVIPSPLPNADVQLSAALAVDPGQLPT